MCKFMARGNLLDTVQEAIATASPSQYKIIKLSKSNDGSGSLRRHSIHQFTDGGYPSLDDHDCECDKGYDPSIYGGGPSEF